jgi:hypothetical protein
VQSNQVNKTKSRVFDTNQDKENDRSVNEQAAKKQYELKEV